MAESKSEILHRILRKLAPKREAAEIEADAQAREINRMISIDYDELDPVRAGAAWMALLQAKARADALAEAEQILTDAIID